MLELSISFIVGKPFYSLCSDVTPSTIYANYTLSAKFTLLDSGLEWHPNCSNLCDC